MTNSIFQINANLPSAGKDITIYSTQQTREMRDKSIDYRAANLRNIFGLEGAMKDLGDKLSITDKNRSINLYSASDSFWFQDDDFFASEKRPAEKLPDEKTAIELATRFFKSNELLLPSAAVHSVSYTTVAVNGPDSDKVDEYNTEVHVNFRHSLEELPIFGPGAKSRISLAGSQTTSGVYQFWRNPQPLKERRELLNPELSLEVFLRNFRFAQLKTDAAKATVDNMTLGYFALSPTAVQNYLLPVYRVTGTISTEALPEYNFDHYIVAVKYTEADVRSMGVSIAGVNAMVF
jgi:hypothetical protein